MGWLARGMRWIVYALATIAGMFGFVVGYAAFSGLDGLELLRFAFLLFGVWPVIPVHELGHAIAALFVGWRVWIFHVAPFALWPRPFAVRFVGDMGGPDTGGFVLALPGVAAVDSWRRAAWVSAGGPIASWLFAALCLSANWWWPAPDFAADDIRRS